MLWLRRIAHDPHTVIRFEFSRKKNYFFRLTGKQGRLPLFHSQQKVLSRHIVAEKILIMLIRIMSTL